ncbi:unnamed protein product, partial [Mesorhabditis belari]|uniref:Uncharacterized protein n=1 Tax=Mesorhabditis belari TaxID=2138241 RepID=A0AAF3F649_9BILA
MSLCNYEEARKLFEEALEQIEIDVAQGDADPSVVVTMRYSYDMVIHGKWNINTEQLLRLSRRLRNFEQELVPPNYIIEEVGERR